MAFSTIISTTIQVGKAIKKELFDLIKGNFDDHETRINSLETGAAVKNIFEFLVFNASSASTLTGLYYYEAIQDFTLTDGFIRIFETGALTGTLEVDIEVSTTDLDDTSFSSVFTTAPEIDFATASDYDASTNQVFNPTKVDIVKGNFLRINVLSMPTNGVLGKFFVYAYGE
jgi:hypothetical protein